MDSTSNADSVFEKGGNSLADSKSITTVTITINGKPYAVATEVAMAMARVTAQGARVHGNSHRHTLSGGRRFCRWNSRRTGFGG